MRSLLVVVVLLALLAVLGHAQEAISTRSTRAEGTLMCGNATAPKVYVRLFKINSDEISNALATAVTNDQGRFIIEGNTANYQGTEEYVTLGRVPRRNYNVGTLNLMVQYPNEARVDDLKGI